MLPYSTFLLPLPIYDIFVTSSTLHRLLSRRLFHVALGQGFARAPDRLVRGHRLPILITVLLSNRGLALPVTDGYPLLFAKVDNRRHPRGVGPPTPHLSKQCRIRGAAHGLQGPRCGNDESAGRL